MKKLAILLILFGLCMANVDIMYPAQRDNYLPSTSKFYQKTPLDNRIFIAATGDKRTSLGPAGKNIAVAADGNTIAIIYCPPSDPYDGNSPFSCVGVAYSTDRGANWITYSPFNGTTPPFRRTYPGLDACANFDVQSGNVFFTWQEGPVGYLTNPGYVMIEENMPSSPSFSSLALIPNDKFPWFPSIAVNPDSNQQLTLAAWSYLNGGDKNIYRWTSNDGGYTWNDAILFVNSIEDTLIDAGPLRWGHDGYGIYFYHDADNTHTKRLPYYVETTDYGQTWGQPDSVMPLSYQVLWWHEFDAEVCADLLGNNFPVMIHNDSPTNYGIIQLFNPNPDNPGSPGAWNWNILNVDDFVNLAPVVYHDTTWTLTCGDWANFGLNIAFEPNLRVILATFRAAYVITPTPAGWTDGVYLGGVVSIDGGRTWRITRPLTGELAGTSIQAEMAHRLVTNYDVLGPDSFNIAIDTIWSYTTWTDAGDGVGGSVYFDLGTVHPINDSAWVPTDTLEAVAENKVNVVPHSVFTVSPTIAKGDVRASFNLVTAGNARLDLFDILGRNIGTAFNGYFAKGEHTIDLNTIGFANGVYIVHLNTDSKTETAKFIITH